MGEKWEKVLTDAIGIPGVHVNSALVSAQNRRRIYWTNIRTKEEGLLGWTVPDIPQPEDRGIMLQDVLDDNVDRKYYLKDEVVDKLLANGVKGA
jgi:DNA (cytosine-5)-methyltransferase 3A